MATTGEMGQRDLPELRERLWDVYIRGGGQFVSRRAARSPLMVSAGWDEKQLPRRLRCSGLAALRAGVGLPPD